MPSNYERGRNLEYEVKRIFEDADWSVIRGSGSKGEVFGMRTDLVATKESAGRHKTAAMVIVQCKLHGTKHNA